MQIMQIMEKNGIRSLQHGVGALQLGISLNIDLIERLGVTQSDVYSRMVLELSAVESSM